MSRKELMEAIKKAYQNGYKTGFTDACDLMKTNAEYLVVSMEKSLDSKTIVVDEWGVLE